MGDSSGNGCDSTTRKSIVVHNTYGRLTATHLVRTQCRVEQNQMNVPHTTQVHQCKRFRHQWHYPYLLTSLPHSQNHPPWHHSSCHPLRLQLLPAWFQGSPHLPWLLPSLHLPWLLPSLHLPWSLPSLHLLW
jgi:hypothetical protein